MSRRTWSRAIKALHCLALFAVLPSAAAAQPIDPPAVTYPAIPPAAASAGGLVPPGWTVLGRKRGDLNADGKADVALLLRMTSKANVVPVPDSRPAEKFDTNPYMMVVAFTDASGKLRTQAVNHRLFRRPDTPHDGDVDPHADTLSIAKGVLVVAFEYLRGHANYRFRWNGSEFALIGYDQGGASGGCVESLSINYPARLAIWSDTPQRAGKVRPVRRRVRVQDIPTLRTIDIDAFDPTAAVVGDPPVCRPY
jgi:hypothetical protein